jgi:hypothetical protein
MLRVPRKTMGREAVGFDGKIAALPKASFETRLEINRLNQAIEFDDVIVSKRTLFETISGI